MITKEEIERSIRGQKAKEHFTSGYNCTQSVLLAFEDYIEGKGLDPKTVLRMASPMCVGISRLSELCFTVSAMCLLNWLTALEFQEYNGSIVCRELLGLSQKHDEPTPSKRTNAYYAKRPCADLCAAAAAIFEKHYL